MGVPVVYAVSKPASCAFPSAVVLLIANLLVALPQDGVSLRVPLMEKSTLPSDMKVRLVITPEALPARETGEYAAANERQKAAIIFEMRMAGMSNSSFGQNWDH